MSQDQVTAEPFAEIPQLDRLEFRILEYLKEAGGRAYRTHLRSMLGGSNTTFMRKIESLKEKGILDEFKTRDMGQRMKTAYAFTSHASRLFEFQEILRMRRWFSASDRIELFPEFDKIARTLMGDDFSVYRLLGIKPQHLSIETTLATSTRPSLGEEQIKELLPMINAYLQNIVTSNLHPTVQANVAGYIIFRYRLEQPNEELEQQVLASLGSYVSSSDPLWENMAIGKLVELGIKNPDLLPKLTIAATNVAGALKFHKELRDVKSKYSSYRKKEEPVQLTRIQLVVALLTIFKKLYGLYHERQQDVPNRGHVEKRG